MNKKEVVVLFMKEVLPQVKSTYEKNGRKDLPARREAWNNFTDALCRDGKITLKQYNTWTHQKCNE